MVICMRKIPLILLFLILLFVPYARAEQEIRVRLTNRTTEYALHISLKGDYTSEDRRMFFQKGSDLTFSTDGKVLYLHTGKLAMDLGTDWKMCTCSEKEDPSGFYFTGEKNLFEGDLRLHIENGTIVSTLYLDIETYLLGVVPYEMGESFPLEALKAQSVAARTYALASVNKGNGYDVVDSTNDQVYRGRLERNVLSEQAVNNTKGIVVTYNHEPAVCYYTASNGGYTELPEIIWPGKAYDYFKVTEDPYDLQNGKSVIKRASIKKERKGRGVNDPLNVFLMDAIHTTNINLGSDAKLERIEGIDADYEKDGHTVRSLLFTVVIDNAGESKTIDFSVPFYGKLEQLLELSINQYSNEVLQIINIGDAFNLETRRFGHGVGLSQRGAEQMALNGLYYYDILSFYYPGTTLMGIVDSEKEKPAPNQHLRFTPEPSPSPTPRPTLMPVTIPDDQTIVGQIVNIQEDSSVNLREYPAFSGTIIRRLYLGQKMIVESTQDDGWVKVRTDSVEGYVRGEYVEVIQNVAH